MRSDLSFSGTRSQAGLHNLVGMCKSMGEGGAKNSPVTHTHTRTAGDSSISHCEGVFSNTLFSDDMRVLATPPTTCGHGSTIEIDGKHYMHYPRFLLQGNATTDVDGTCASPARRSGSHEVRKSLDRLLSKERSTRQHTTHVESQALMAGVGGVSCRAILASSLCCACSLQLFSMLGGQLP